MADRGASHWPISLSSGAGSLLNLLLPLALVRILSPEEVGRYKIFFLYLMLSPGLLLTSGLANGLYHWIGSYPQSRPRIRQGWTWLVILSLSLCAAGALACGTLSPLVRIPPADLRLLFLSIPAALMSLFFEDLLIARGELWKGALYGAGLNALQAAALLAAALWGGGVEALLRTFFFCALLRAAAGALLLAASGDIAPLFSLRESAAVLRYALPVSLAALAVLATQNADMVILSSLLDPAAFAFYAMGCLSLPPLYALEVSVNRILIPELARSLAAGRRQEAAEAFREAVAELFRYLLPAAVGLAVYAHPIILLLFTSRYEAAAEYLQVFSACYLIMAFPRDAVARARGDSAWILRTALLFGPLSVLGVWLAAARWGAMGALAAVVAVRLLMGLYAQAYHRRRLGPYAGFLPFGEMAARAALALGTAGLALLARSLFSSPLAWFLTTGPLFAAAYFGLAWLLELGPRRSEPIRVLELAQTLCFGGLERLVYSLAARLNELKEFSVLVVSYDHPPEEPSLVPRLRAEGIPCVHWRKRESFSPASVLRLAGLVFSRRAHILHAHDLGPLIYGSLAKLLTLGRTRLILTVHSLLDLRRDPRHLRYFLFFLRFADRVVTVSPSIKEELTTLGVEGARVEVVPNGASFAEGWLPEPSRRDSLRRELVPGLAPGLSAARWILCLGRVHPGKGQDVVLQVWEALPPQSRAASALFFVGQKAHPEYWEELRRRIAASERPERIVLAPPSERPQDWLLAADVFISGSLYEAMPLAPLEAAGSGVPTVLSDIEGHRFLRGWALYFDPGKPREGARRLLQVLKSMEGPEPARVRQASWLRAEALRRKWGSPAMTAAYAGIFQSVHASKAPAQDGEAALGRNPA